MLGTVEGWTEGILLGAIDGARVGLVVGAFNGNDDEQQKRGTRKVFLST